MPTISTVPFQSPSLPTNSHFPVTVTSPDGALLELEVAGLALVVLAGLVAGDGDAGAVVLPPQELTAIISPTKMLTSMALLVFVVFRIRDSPDSIFDL